MRALVVYESLWGNTEQVARAVAAGLAVHADVEVVDSDAAPLSVVGYDLLVVGGPTHAFSMTRAATRADAVKSHAAPHEPGRGIREWLTSLNDPARRSPQLSSTPGLISRGCPVRQRRQQSTNCALSDSTRL